MHSALEVRDTGRYGLGVFARSPVSKNETLFVCGGPILTLEDEDNLPPECADMPIEISKWFSIGPRTLDEIPLMPQHYVNHSCDPNAGWRDQLLIVAMREIEAGEEVHFDYSMVMHSNPESKSFWEMECRCQSPSCRGRVAEDDWKRPELQARYDGWFAWHLQKKLNAAQTGHHGDVVAHPPDKGRRSGFHWVSDAVVGGDSPVGGRGCFAATDIPSGSIVIVFGGRVYTVGAEASDYGLQIAENFCIGPRPEEATVADFVNHSCEPNIGFSGSLSLVTLRGIHVGEELMRDYGTCDSSPCFCLECRCGSPQCRRVISGDDWKSPKYAQSVLHIMAANLRNRVLLEVLNEAILP